MPAFHAVSPNSLAVLSLFISRDLHLLSYLAKLAKLAKLSYAQLHVCMLVTDIQFCCQIR
jgi:hypothetical protein